MSTVLLRNLIAIIMIIALTGCDKITEPVSVEDTTAPIKYELSWSEEFDQQSTTLNPDIWNYDLGYGDNGWGNNEWQLYTNSSDNVKVQDGMLMLTAQCVSGIPGKRNGSITSARINTKNKFSQKYGKVEARIKVPASTGIWPAFWMLGSNIDLASWPKCGEIDIMEISPLYHNDKTTMCTVHWYDEQTASNQNYGTHKEMNVPLTADFHNYSVEWDKQRIIGKIDGITYFVKTIDPATMSEFLNKFFLVLNVAVGGNLGGIPDNTTQWPQTMFVDWIRVYEAVSSSTEIKTFGIFTDKTPVDARITPGSDADIYVWDNTLAQGAYPPYEGNGVLTWITRGTGWFGAGIKSRLPLDLSNFEAGNLKFRIKIPSNVTFQIGINDMSGHESFVSFPAGETKYGLVRSADWGQATIPYSDLKGSVDLENLDYVFIIKEANGVDCHFAIDDIYLDGGNIALCKVSFDKDLYSVNEGSAKVNLIDESKIGTTASVKIFNKTDSISVDIALNNSGNGTGIVSFGTTNDATNTIKVAKGDTLKVRYIDANSNKKEDFAPIFDDGTFAVYTDDPLIRPGLTPGVNASIFVWEQTLIQGSILPYEGSNVISWKTNSKPWFGAGIAGNAATNMSEFSNGNLNFMIKIPANLTFKIGITDNTGKEKYVQFPANQTVFNLTRNGEWGQVIIPVSQLTANLDLAQLKYLFAIVADNAIPCEFAIDHIYYDGKAVVK